ncbi:MAG: chorismate mutase [Kiritimatiellae bacterium]|nr:chorismate mutase [Kiritimatiellia bacterium]
MESQLALNNIRNTLTRLEETIIFGLIERAQFCRNAVIYEKGGVGKALKDESLVDFLLHECERSQAKVRRYTSPDEHPFFDDLPEPILPGLDYENPLKPNTININATIKKAYEEGIVPYICAPGDDRQWGSSSVCDVTNLQALSKRIHYGKFVAEGKCRLRPAHFAELIKAGDEAGLMRMITDEAVENEVLERVYCKATTYGREFEGNPGQYKVDPDAVRTIYARWIIPLNKQVQVQYLLARGEEGRGSRVEGRVGA